MVSIKHKGIKMQEEWRTIPSIPTHEASSLGQIRSKTRISVLERKNKDGSITQYSRSVKSRTMYLNNNTRKGKESYVMCSINDSNYLVHRIIAETFCENNSGISNPQVNHKDGNKRNNIYTNLEWVTASQNETHSHRVLGKITWNKGIKFDTTKQVAVRNKNYAEKRKFVVEVKNITGWSNKILAIYFDRCIEQIRAILRREEKEVI